MPKKKSADEARLRLKNKLEEVKTKAKQLHDFIDNLSNEAIVHGETALKETSKSKFLHGYSKASEQLESCLNKFLLISDALETMDGSDEENDEEDDEEADENESETLASVSTAIDSSIFITTNSTIINENISTVLPDTNDASVVVRKRSNSQESLFSSVSMQRHSTPKITNSAIVLSTDIKVEKYKWKRGFAYPVLITNFISPWEFYLQLVDPRNDVMEQMCIAFMKEATRGYKGGIDVMPKVGYFCCAKYEDNTWYRAQIMEVYSNNSSNGGWTVKVFFIDEGFFSIVGPTHLRPLAKKYADMLPSQAFHCVLGGVQPFAALKEKEMLSFKNCSSLWTSESISWFQQKMDLGLFNAFFYNLPKSAHIDPHNLDPNILVCDLYLHQPDSKCKLWQFSYERPALELHLSFMLIAQKMGTYCPYFQSELSRNASQQILKEAIPELTDTNKEESNNKSYQTPIIKNTKRQSKKDCERGKKAGRRDNTKIDKKVLETTPMKVEIISVTKNVPDKVIELPRTPSPKEVSSLSQSPDVFRSNTPELVSSVIAIEEKTTSFKFGETFQEMKLSVKRDTFLKVMVSEVVNPGLFYIHLVSPEIAKLDEMMDELNTFYDMKADEMREKANAMVIDEGVAVIAKYQPDNRWYRALIVSKDDDQEDGEMDKFNVLYVDFGNSDVVSINDILPVCKKFCELPMETIACCLADVDPLSPLISSEKPTVIPAGDESSEEEGVIITEIEVSPRNSQSSLSRWSEKSLNAFKNIALTGQPLLAALKVSEKNSNGLYEVYLYDTTNDHDLFINQYLVDESVATSKVFSKKTPVNQESQMESEQGQMALWNPMEEQYFSKRNAYSVDVNNPAVATLGYVEKERNICHQFLRGRCYRGSGCRFAHVKPGEMPNDYEEVFCTDDVIDMPELGDWVPVTVTALLNPSHFWINFPCGIEMFSDQKKSKDYDGEENPLIRLNETLNEYYGRLKRDDKTDLTILAEGEMVAARFQDSWYRARVVNTAEDLVQVFYVDYGNTTVVNEEDIRKLLPDFLHLPLQAVECYLNGVNVEDELMENNLILYNDLRVKFQEMTADKLLMALVVSRSPRKDLIMDLYDTSTTPHTHINNLVSTWNGMTSSKKVPNKVRKNSSNKKTIMFPG